MLKKALGNKVFKSLLQTLRHYIHQTGNLSFRMFGGSMKNYKYTFCECIIIPLCYSANWLTPHITYLSLWLLIYNTASLLIDTSSPRS